MDDRIENLTPTRLVARRVDREKTGLGEKP
jgi:hypothetical protein